MYKIFFNDNLYKEFKTRHAAYKFLRELERTTVPDVFAQYRLEESHDEEWAWQDSGIEQF